ncbi:MAG: hypothetical protein FIA91_03395 [Geobacter sp.]|nr:hypothetical protein [Geobacter sp.]
MHIGLRYKLMGIVLLAALPFLFYAVHHYVVTLDENKTKAIIRNMGVAEETAEKVGSFINSTQNVLYSLALHPAVINQDSKKCDEIFSQLLPLYPANEVILAADMTGRNYGSALKPEIAHTLNYSDRDWFVGASKGVSYVSNHYISKLLKNSVFMIAVPVFAASGIQKAVLGFPVNLPRLKEHLQEIEKVDVDANFCLIDSKGTILIDSSNSGAIGKSFNPGSLLQKIAKERSGSLVALDQHGVEQLYSYATIESTGWKVLVGTPSATVSIVANRDALRHLFFFVLICLTGGLTSLWYSQKLGKRVENIINGLNEVATGNYSLQLAVDGNDELAKACTAFNQMTAEMAKAEEKIKNFTQTLEKKVSNRTAELNNAKNELEAFSYAVSHDLQAPVRHILAYSQILLEEHAAGLPESSLHHLQRINRSGENMRNLITHLLDLSRLGSQQIMAVSVDLGSLAGEILRELAENDPGHVVEIRIQEGLLATGDKSLLGIAMRNLLENAWKYGRNAAAPLIEVGRTGSEEPAFFVRDNGCGFDMAHSEGLFMPFQRLHSADQYEGTGIGLATVFRIISRHGGRIWAESQPGMGAVFYLTLQHVSDKS